MTADTLGGVWTYALELIEALQSSGVEVLLATMGAPLSRSQREQAAALPNLEIAESAYRLEWMDDPWLDVARAGDWLLRCARDFGAELAHINGYAHAALDWRIPVVAVAHSCVLSWWQAVKGAPAPAHWSHYQRAVTRGLNAADEIVAPTESMLRNLKVHYGSDRGRVIANGRKANRFSPAAKEPFIFSAGRLWDEAKNVMALDKAAADLRWPVYVAGEGQHPSCGSAQTASVCSLGQLSADRLAHWLARASIFAAPVRYEPFGLSILEAALNGCALVLGEIDSLRELWDGCARFVTPDDSDHLAFVLNRLSTQRHEREELAARARTRALDFSTEAMSARYMQAYVATSAAFREELSCES